MTNLCGMMLTGTILCMVSAVSTQAFICRLTDKKVNRLFPGTVSVNLTEEMWESKQGEHCEPGKVIRKNPVAQNTGRLPAWVFLQVDVPLKTIITVDPTTKRKLPLEKKELFSYVVNDGWTLLEKKEQEEHVEYVYGYQKIVVPGEKTESLFDTVEILNYLEGQLKEEDVMTIPITAMEIQSSVAEDGAELRDIYQIYLEQNENGGTGV